MQIVRLGDLFRDFIVVEFSDSSVRLMESDGCPVWTEKISLIFSGQNPNSISDVSESIEKLSKLECSHGRAILGDLRKLLLNEKRPYDDEELCHCRVVTTSKVMNSIWYGAETTEDVARVTSAGTACGTCRPNSQKLIDYCLKI